MPATARPPTLKELDAYEKAHALRIALARENSALFTAYVLRNDRTGDEITMAPMHKEWHRLKDAHDQLILFGFTGAGKTAQITAMLLYAIGRNPNIRIVVLGNTHDQAKKIVRSVRQYIERSESFHEVFPDCVKSEHWTDDSFTVKRDSFSKDPTVRAYGVHGSVLGSRIDLLVLDDIVDHENSATPAARKKLYEWYNSTVFGRLAPGESRTIAIGNAWHLDDLLHIFSRQAGWVTRRFPVVSPTDELAWPDVWPEAAIAKRRQQLGSFDFQRQMLCIVPGGGTNKIRQWVEQCIALGDGKRINARLKFIPAGIRVFTGVDLAIQKGDGHDWTVILTIAVNAAQQRQVIGIDRARLNGPEIIAHLQAAHAAYHPQLILVESNAAQDFIRQFAVANTALPIRAFITGKNKSNPQTGVQSLFVEMENGKWIFPSSGGQVEECLSHLVDDLVNYDPTEHTGDALMAMWFAREAIALSEIKAEASTNWRYRAR